MVSVTAPPHSRSLIRADLERAPDDGHRYELVDVALVVTPAPPYRSRRFGDATGILPFMSGRPQS
jgi:hypothetical protein